jgi:hypothetical protein
VSIAIAGNTAKPSFRTVCLISATVPISQIAARIPQTSRSWKPSLKVRKLKPWIL